MYLRFLLGLILLIVALNLSAQVNDGKIRLEVLRKNSSDEEFTFVNSDSSRTILKYLGQIETKDKRTYKVLTSIWRWGSELHRATSRILFFNTDNQYIGEYGLGMTYELPYKLSNNCLLFSVDEDNCKDKTKIDFQNGIPESIFILCGGDYSFYSQ